MTIKKKLLSVILVIALTATMLAALAACGKATVKVTFDLNYEGSSPVVVDVEKGSTVTPPDVSREGYKLDGWAPEATSPLSFNFATAIEADRTFYARWKAELQDNYPNPGTKIGTLTGSKYKLEVFDSKVSKVYEIESGKFVDSFQNYAVMSSYISSSVVFGEWITGEYKELTAYIMDGALTMEYENDVLKTADYTAITTVEENKELLQVIGPDAKAVIESNGQFSTYFNVGDGYGGWMRTAMGFWTIKQNTKDDYSADSVAFNAYIGGVQIDSGINTANNIYLDITVKLGDFSRSNIVTERPVNWVPALLGYDVPVLELTSSGANVVELYYGGITEEVEQKDKDGNTVMVEVIVGNVLKIVNSSTKATIVTGEWEYNNATNAIVLDIADTKYPLKRMSGQWNYNTLAFEYDGVSYATETIDWEDALLAKFPAEAAKGLAKEKLTAKASGNPSNVADYTLTLFEDGSASFYGVTSAGAITARSLTNTSTVKYNKWVRSGEDYVVTITDREWGEFSFTFAKKDGVYKTTVNLDEKAGLTDHITAGRIFGDIEFSFSEISHVFNGMITSGMTANTALIMRLREDGSLSIQDIAGTGNNAYGTYTYDANADKFSLVIKDAVSNKELFKGDTTKTAAGIYEFEYEPIKDSIAVMRWQENPTATAVFSGKNSFDITITATFYTDGSVVVDAGQMGKSTGGWRFDSEKNTYHYSAIDSNGDANGRSGSSTYDEATKTYTIKYRSLGADVELKYTAAQ